jgi:PilZ domain/Gram-negative bacterial TonB protein C-terminal
VSIPQPGPALFGFEKLELVENLRNIPAGPTLNKKGELMMHLLPEKFADLPESNDRRGRVRRNPSALAYLEVGEGNGGIVLNVSETGLAVAVAQAFAGTQVPILSFRLPQLDRTFQASGEIVWRSESKKSAGIRFVNLAEQDRAQIRNWIRAEIVEAELQTPRGTERARADTKPVLIMPSPRKVVRELGSEAERDEARAAEFDRMFPSEASLVAPPPVAKPEFDSEIADAAKAANAAQVLLEQEELNPLAVGLKAPVVEAEQNFIVAAELPGAEPAALPIPAEADWRDEWKRFHVQRETVERARTFEMTAPTPMRSLIGESIFGQPASIGISTAAVAPESTNVAHTARSAEQQQRTITGNADVHTQAGPSSAPPRGERKKNTLGIAALSTFLVVMCFILGYAIQPGAFRFSAVRSSDVKQEVPREVANEPVAQENLPPLSASSAENTENPLPPSSALRATPGEKTAGTYAEKSSAATQPNDSLAAKSPPTEPAIGTVTTTPLAITAGHSAITESPKPAPSAPSPEIVIDAPVPVSFFPVTAPSGGSPAKMMQLPEETISETPAVVIRSRQFLFVPSQPGPESTHELERVHVGDRVVKVDPIYPAGSLEKAVGTVHLRSTIGTDGAVADVQPISGPVSLIPAAVSAVRQWRYKPTDIDGKPIAVEEDVVLEFRPGH